MEKSLDLPGFHVFLFIYKKGSFSFISSKQKCHSQFLIEKAIEAKY